MAITRAELALKMVLAAFLVNGTDLSEAKDQINTAIARSLSYGTGADQINQAWHDRRTIAASSSEELDLAGGLTNSFGATVTFAKVKLIIVVASDGNTNSVVIGGASSNAFLGPFGDATDTIRIGPNGLFVACSPDSNGYAVTAGTGDKLKIANSSSGTEVTYDIYIFGVE